MNTTSPSSQDITIKPNLRTLGLHVRTKLQAGRGLGDVVADFTASTRLDRVADWVSRTTGRDCGCDARREKLNDLAHWG